MPMLHPFVELLRVVKKHVMIAFIGAIVEILAMS